MATATLPVRENKTESQLWSRYLDQTKGLKDYDYEYAEPIAWTNLMSALGRVKGTALKEAA